MILNPTTPSAASTAIDVELIAQRILKLAEIATLEHLEAVAQSQANGLVELVNQLNQGMHN